MKWCGSFGSLAGLLWQQAMGKLILTANLSWPGEVIEGAGMAEAGWRLLARFSNAVTT